MQVKRIMTGSTKRSGQGFTARIIKIGQHHARPFGGECFSASGTDTRRGAGNQRDLALVKYEDAKTLLDADEQVALRGLLPSEMKTDLRKMAEARQKQQLAAMAGSQA
jgi:hypothetical protein